MRKGEENTKTIMFPLRLRLNEGAQGVRPSGLMGQLPFWPLPVLASHSGRKDVWSYSDVLENGSCTARKTINMLNTFWQNRGSAPLQV